MQIADPRRIDKFCVVDPDTNPEGLKRIPEKEKIVLRQILVLLSGLQVGRLSWCLGISHVVFIYRKYLMETPGIRADTSLLTVLATTLSLTVQLRTFSHTFYLADFRSPNFMDKCTRHTEIFYESPLSQSSILFTKYLDPELL
jgi:hypothetical protein